MADRNQPITEEEADRAMRVIDASQLLAGGSGSDIEQTFLGAITTVAAAAEEGRKEDWIAALRSLGQIVLAVAEREAAFAAQPERQWQRWVTQLKEAKTAAAPPHQDDF